MTPEAKWDFIPAASNGLSNSSSVAIGEINSSGLKLGYFPFGTLQFYVL